MHAERDAEQCRVGSRNHVTSRDGRKQQTRNQKFGNGNTINTQSSESERIQTLIQKPGCLGTTCLAGETMVALVVAMAWLRQAHVWLFVLLLIASHSSANRMSAFRGKLRKPAA